MVSLIPAAAVFAWEGKKRAQCPASIGRDEGRNGGVSHSRGCHAPVAHRDRYAGGTRCTPS